MKDDKEEILRKQKNSQDKPIADYIGETGYVWSMILNAMQEYADQEAEKAFNAAREMKQVKVLVDNASYPNLGQFKNQLIPKCIDFKDYLNNRKDAKED